MSLLYQESSIYQSYEKEVLHLRKKGSRLLNEIKQQEIRINQRKQQKLQPLAKQFSNLKRMIYKMLNLMALIDAYRYFQILNLPLLYHQTFFEHTVNQNFEHLHERFLTSFYSNLKKKSTKQHNSKKQKQQKSKTVEKQKEEDEDELVDFTIN